MDKRLEEYFVKQYPNLFRDYGGDMRQTCMAWGCSCGNGWFYLMDAAFKIAEHPGVVLLQVKEKFGGLRLYWTAPGPPDSPAMTEEEIQVVRTALDTAEGRSYSVCETCGDPGKTRGGGWVHTMCDRCDGFNQSSRTYDIDADDRFMLGSLADATGDRIARLMGLRTTCATEKDHQPNYDYTHCVICKEMLRVVLPAVEREEDKATVTDCPHECDGQIRPEVNVKYPKWVCDTCGKRIGLVQMVIK